MLVRIRWHKLTPPQDTERFGKYALLGAALLTPSALVAFTMTFWIIASDLRWTNDFFLTSGLFSHWQVWLCTAAVLLLTARLLDRIGRVKRNPAPAAAPRTGFERAKITD